MTIKNEHSYSSFLQLSINCFCLSLHVISVLTICLFMPHIKLTAIVLLNIEIFDLTLCNFT